MKTLLLLLSFLMLTTSHIITSQTFEIPQNIKLENIEDYKKTEKDILECINWIEDLPFNEQDKKRKYAYKFLLSWLSENPYISIEINKKIVNFTENNAQFLIIFMAGWTKYSIENPNDKDIIKQNLYGIKSVIKVYKNDDDVKIDRNLEKLIKLEKTNKLENWIKFQIEGGK